VKIELEVSEDNEGTSEPYWIILDPQQNMSRCVHSLANQITGIFFSRESAKNHLKSRSYAFSDRAKVYCHSGCWSSEYKDALKKAKLKGNNDA